MADGSGARTAAVVLAAGAGRRFDGPGHKLAAVLGDGSTLAARAAATALAAGIGPVVVVIGAEPVERLGLPDGCTVVANERWADGQATSLRAAVAWATAGGIDALVVGLADQPGLTAEAWRAVAASSTPIAVATYDGRRGHPVRLAASLWPALPTTGDEGARSLLAARPDLVTEVPVAGDPTDVDTVADLTAWRARADP